MPKYTRTPTAMESALSHNSPMKLNMSLFENYKVASKLPQDAFQQICMQAAADDVSCFDPAGNKPTELQELLNDGVKY
jgi:ABC-type transport system involved in cytochrome c biogenesis ATPase subunit